MPPVLEEYRHVEHGLASLVSAADMLLAAIGRGVGDERVSSRPDARTLRYYQSLGILDRPLRHDGREAVYGFRHLLQAVVTKLLQAEGLSLAQVQRALAGRTDVALEAAVAEALAVASRGDAPGGGGVAPPATPPPPAGAPLLVSDSAQPVYRTDASRHLLTREVAPGVLVTVDPRLVSEPEAVLARIERALHLVPTGGSR